jgi:two-component system, NtrC family, sensor kinase
VRLAAKLIFALVLGLVLVAAGFTWVRVDREVSLIDDDIRRDHAAMGWTLASSVANVFRYDGAKRALELVAEADRLKSHVRLRWVWMDPAPGEPGPLVDAARLRGLAAGSVLHAETTAVLSDTELVRVPDGDNWLVTYAGVPGPDGRKGGIEIAESLGPKQAYIRATIINAAASAAVMVLTCTLIVLVLSLWLVGRPLARLAAKARRVGSGDWSEPLDLSQRDEVGELAREMNAMCERLAAAHERVRGEAEARIAALEQLRHADRLMTVGHIAAGIAHELGTPLNVVTGRAQLIARGKARDQDARQYASIIVDQCERIAAIIRQLLDYARVSKPKRTRQDLRALTRDTLQLLQPLADKRNVQLELEAPDSIPVDVDAVRIQQAITNLVMNAMHASASSHKIRVLLCRSRETVPEELGGGERDAILLRVCDEGSGIDSANLARVFDPFFTTKPPGEGAGLGLSVTQGIVREHRGWITVDTALGNGTTFNVHLPCPG